MSTMLGICSRVLSRVVFRPANFRRLFSKCPVSAKTRRFPNHQLSRRFRADRVLLDEQASRPTPTNAVDERSLFKATNVEDATVLEWEDGTRSSFHHIWLRDHCRCSDCYNAETHQKQQNLLGISNLSPKDIQTKEDELLITWPDDHVTRFTASWLRQHTYDDAGNEKLKPESCEAGVNLYLWDKEMIESNKPPHLRFEQVLEDELEWLKLCETIIRYGFAFVRETPTQIQALQQMSEALGGFVRTTHFGSLYEFSNEAMDHADTAYTAAPLRAHTDSTYLTETPGLALLHCVGHDGTGGMSLLVDGFHAAEKLRQENRQAFQLLTSTNVPFEYIVENLHLQAYGPIIELHPFKGNIHRIRYNTYDQAPLTALKYEDIPKFYDALKAFAALTCAPENQHWYKLVPGELIIMANWRVLHGRTTFTGKRVMQGCYVSRDHFTGKFQSVAPNKSN